MSVFALRPRELRHSPLAGADAAHLTRDDISRVLIACTVAFVLSLALIFSLLALPVAQQNGPVAAPHIVRPAWSEIQKPFRLFGLNSPEWGRQPTAYRAERHRDGGRRDHLTFGTFDSNQPWLHLTLYRIGSEDSGPAPFFVDMARRAAPAGLAVAHMGQPKPLPTRFGSFQVAEFTLEGQSGASGQSTKCLGFRLADAKVLQIGGFACGAPGRATDRARLACTIDAIDLVAAGDDAEMRAFFTGAPAGSGLACRPSSASEAQLAEPAPGNATGNATSGFTVLR
jgi:hypothetical protein